MKSKQVREKIEKIIKKNATSWLIEETPEKFRFKFIILDKPIIIENIYGDITNNAAMYIKSYHLMETIKFEDIYKIIPYELSRYKNGLRIELKNGSKILLK